MAVVIQTPKGIDRSTTKVLKWGISTDGQHMSTNALKRAVELLGGQSATAEALEVSQGAVWKWLNRMESKRTPPAEHVLKLERLTGGKVKRHQLRPDLYPME